MPNTIKTFVLGPLENNTYVVSNEDKKCLIIDPAGACGEVLSYIAASHLKLESIVLTHAHFDHIMGIPEVLAQFPGTPVYIHPEEKILLSRPDYNGSVMFGRSFTFTDKTVDCGEDLTKIGSLAVTVLHVPGHSPGSVALVMDGVCFSGDVLFARSIGRSDFPGGDGDLLIKSIKTKLLVLPDETVVYAGHGGRTTIGSEKKHNPFLQ